jgi:protein-S-isoprenylcysteine O-methyltransferase Ste14
MKKVIKHLVSFILPVTVLVIVPAYIEPRISVRLTVTFLTGTLIMLIGLYIMVLTLIKFVTIGKGTLAPRSPTRKLVTSGIYSYDGCQEQNISSLFGIEIT